MVYSTELSMLRIGQTFPSQDTSTCPSFSFRGLFPPSINPSLLHNIELDGPRTWFNMKQLPVCTPHHGCSPVENLCSASGLALPHLPFLFFSLCTQGAYKGQRGKGVIVLYALCLMQAYFISHQQDQLARMASIYASQSNKNTNVGHLGPKEFSSPISLL